MSLSIAEAVASGVMVLDGRRTCTSQGLGFETPALLEVLPRPTRCRRISLAPRYVCSFNISIALMPETSSSSLYLVAFMFVERVDPPHRERPKLTTRDGHIELGEGFSHLLEPVIRQAPLVHCVSPQLDPG